MSPRVRGRSRALHHKRGARHNSGFYTTGEVRVPKCLRTTVLYPLAKMLSMGNRVRTKWFQRVRII